MTRIRKLLLSFRANRAQRLNRSDSVSFDAFCNEGPTDQYPVTKESSLSDKVSPNHSMRPPYSNFSKIERTAKLSECTRPSLITIFFIFLLVAVFLILPIIYLLHCFNLIHVNNETEPSHNFAIKSKEHYEPSEKVHKALKGEGSLVRNTDELPPPPKPDEKQCSIKNDDRFDCYPENGASAENCEARGCCWIPPSFGRKRTKAPLDVPYCFYPKNYKGYKFTNITEMDFGLIAFMVRKYKSGYPDDVETLKIIVKYETEDRLHFKILDPEKIRFEPPYPYVPVIDKAPNNLSYVFEINTTASGFKVIRKEDNTVLFDTINLQSMIFSNQFLQISSLLSSRHIYGIGEHRTNFLLSTNWKRLTLFNHDGIPSENTNLYGSHPFYLNIEPSTKSHGVFLLNSNAMDVILQPTPAITFRTIGGILDFYIMLGPTPRDVIRQYTDLIGRPQLPPYWALGFHLCRFGYNSLDETKKVMQRTIDAGIPLDTQWNDLDYMNNSNDFTYDHVNYKGLPDFVKDLHKRGMHYVPLIDPGVSASEKPGQYPPFDVGIKMGIFIKNSSGQPFIGKVWNKATTVWPDFTNPDTVNYWTLMLRSLHDLILFDGAWIDMNEPSNFLSGSFDGCPKSDLENPPYLPGVEGNVLNFKTLCMSANHSAGLHYDIHNLYGFVEAIATNFALAEIRGKRPMIISRSTFPGHGKYAGHWSGDVYSKWKDMRFSVPQLLSFSLFGIPLMGADICGFNGNTTVPLCNRWTQLGAFYPFSRNHNTDDGIEQDPVALGPNVVASAKKALSIRYTLLPYLYTLFYLAHTDGDTVARPLLFNFIHDNNTFGIDDQFMWGSGLMIVPVLVENREWVNPYIPEGVWYDYYTFNRVQSGGWFNISAPLDTIPLLIHGGNIIPQQSPMQTTTAARKTKMQLLVAADDSYNAKGLLYWDDGDSLNSVEERKYSLISFDLKKFELNSTVLYWGPETPPNIGVVKVLGIPAVTKVFINKIELNYFRYDTVHKYLLIENIDISLKDPINITWK